jgi:hypothetical protein
LVNKYGLLREELVPKKDLVKLGNDEYVENIYDEVVKEINVKSCSPIPSSDTVLLGVTNKDNFVLLNKKYEILYKLNEIDEVNLVIIRWGVLCINFTPRKLIRKRLKRSRSLKEILESIL